MTATSLEQVPLPDLSDLRGFVVLVNLIDLANHTEAAGAYFETFGPDDDATLVVYAPTDDLGWAQWLARRVIDAGGADPANCADVRLYLVPEDGRFAMWFARRTHALIAAGDGSWLPLRRPTYGFDEIAAVRVQAERLWASQHGGAGQPRRPPYSYEAAMEHLVARGWTTEHHTRIGSVPEAALAHAVEAFEAELPPGDPRILHVGNYLGVSLSYFLHWALGRDGTVVSVDPDIPHRGVERPQRAVCDLLSHFGLTDGHVLVCGYSLEKSFSNDGVVFDDYDPNAAWAQECAPENVLPALIRAGHEFDAAFIDGNHDPAYLRREVQAIGEMLVPGGLLVLDDIDQAWTEIRRVFEEVGGGDWPFAPVLADGRIGILRRL